MSRRPPLVPAVLLSLSVAATSCSDVRDLDAPRTPASITVVDAAGTEHRMEGPAQRIISLVPSATLSLAALGAADLLVARTDYDTVQWAMDLPSVGGGILPSQELIVSLQPDLVIRFAGEQDVTTPAMLDQLGIRHIAIRPDRIEDIRASLRLMGAVTGHDEEAANLVRALDAALAQVHAEAAEHPPVRVAYVLGGTPPWVAGPGTYVHEVIEIAGGVNVFADLDRLYASVSPEEFVARNIDVIVTPSAASVPTGIPHGARVVEVGDLLELPGPGVADAARRLAEYLAAGETSGSGGGP
jgi:iron complex transport system substrate-binding protein